MPRPAVSVVVPFAGTGDEARRVVAALRSLPPGPDDEVLLADNTPDGVASVITGGGVRVVRATAEASSYHARNVGAHAAANDWLLFLDADCEPDCSLLDAYFSQTPADTCGIVVGEVAAVAGQPGVVARYQRSRGFLSQAANVSGPWRPFGVTANLLVRRAAWASVGGFQEGIRSNGDTDFCWRVQDAGWTLDFRPAAFVRHRHRERTRDLARQAACYGAGRRWLLARHPGSHPRPAPIRGLARALAGVVAWTVTGRTERARFKALDGVTVLGESAGFLLENRAGRRAALVPRTPDVRRVVYMLDRFPVVSETFVTNEIAALGESGVEVAVEAGGRPDRPAMDAPRDLPVRYLEDDGIARRLADLVWLVARHPRACARDLLDRRRWRREEWVRPLASLAAVARRVHLAAPDHLHAHFAAGAALDAMRLSRLIGVPYSVTAHAYDIFLIPRNLAEKLERAAFAMTVCEYNARHLRTVAPAARLHTMVMGVDGRTFRRRTPPPQGRTVAAVGRLVEKKGFADLVSAAALLAADGPLDRLIIIGDGPLLGELEALARERGIAEAVTLLGARDPDGVRAVLEQADLLAMPCVVAADGDRDSMPVVVKEALAMEVPVVGTREVALPEMITDAWGRLVAPGDPAALAAAIDELLTLPPDERAQLGAAGRAFVLEHCDVRAETAKLSALIAQSTNVR